MKEQLAQIVSLEAHNAVKAERDALLTVLRELYRDANPTFFEDADKGVRLPPRWNERLKEIIENENQEG